MLYDDQADWFRTTGKFSDLFFCWICRVVSTFRHHRICVNRICGFWNTWLILILLICTWWFKRVDYYCLYFCRIGFLLSMVSGKQADLVADKCKTAFTRLHHLPSFWLLFFFYYLIFLYLFKSFSLPTNPGGGNLNQFFSIMAVVGWPFR